MDRLGGSVALRACGFVLAKWLALWVLAVRFGAAWPHETATRSASENWMVFAALVALCVTLNLAVAVTLIRPARLSGFAVALTLWLTANLVLFEFAFLGAMLFPERFSLGFDWRLRTVVVVLLAGCAPFVVALLRPGDPVALPPERTMLARLILWVALLAALGFVYWALPEFLNRD